jgi:hypothetical protein
VFTDPAGPVLVVMFLLLAVTTALVKIRNSDIFQHLALGRWIAQGHLPLGTDPLTSPGGEVVASAHHTWLFDLTLYLLFLIGGGILIGLVKVVLTLLVVEQQRRFATLPHTRAAPAVLCLLLGLVVLSPYLLVQSRLASIVLLSTTVFLLGRYRGASAERPAPPIWALPVLCLVWANLDNWFFLGPLCIGLFAAGILLEEEFRPVQEDGSPKQGRALLTVFGASLVAMCLNPGLLALRFDLPPELGLNRCLAYVGELPGYTYLSASPVGSGYFDITTGWSVAGQAYFLLLLLALVSFPLLGRRMSWAGLFVVAALALLSLYRVAAIPFLAVAATPWLARNIQELLQIQAEQQERAGEKQDATAGVPLAGLLLVVAWVATFPGWLNAWPWANWRVGLGLEEEADLKAMAERTARLGEWYREKASHQHGGESTTETPTWLNTSPTVAHYIAWFAPEQRCYLDQRLLLSADAASDYLKILQAPYLHIDDLVHLSPEKSLKDLPDRYEVVRKRGVHLIACHQAHLLTSLVQKPPSVPPEEQPRYIPEVSKLFEVHAFFGDWPILDLRGATTLLGFRDPKDRTQDRFFSEKVIRPSMLAFDRPTGESGVPGTLPVPTQEAEPRVWITTLWNPEPPRTMDTQEAAQLALLYDASKIPQFVRVTREWEHIRATAVAGHVLSSGTTPAWQIAMTSAGLQTRLMSANPPTPLARVFFDDKDIGNPGPLYLMLRAARRSVAENPFDPQAHALLAQAYYQISQETRERLRSQPFHPLRQLRRFQIIAAAQAAVRLDPDLEKGHRLLAATYEQMGCVDLCLDHLREAVRCNVAAGPMTGEKPEDAQKRWKAQDEHLQALVRDVENRKNRFTVRTAKMKDLHKAALALQPLQPDGTTGVGLIRVAADIFDKLSVEELSGEMDGTRPGPSLRVESMFLLGKLNDVKNFLGTESDPEGLGIHPTLGIPTSGWYRICLGACSGDYQLADDAAAAVLAKMQADPSYGVARKQSAGLVADLIATMAGRVHVPPPPQSYMLPGGPDKFFAAINQAQHALLGPANEAALHTLRAWVALEPGDIDKVRQELDAALKVAERADITYSGQGIALLGQDLLKRGQEAARAP